MNEEIIGLLQELEDKSFAHLVAGDMESYVEVVGDIVLAKEVMNCPNSLSSIEEKTFLLNKYRLEEVSR